MNSTIYRVIWRAEAEFDLEGLPLKTSTAIVKKVEAYLSQNPRQLGMALTGKFAGQYRYRMGDYRIIYTIEDKEVVIHVLQVGHRKNIYH